MKNSLSVFVLLLLLGCEFIVKQTPQNKTLVNAEVQALPLDLITAEELKETVTYLASDELQGRNTGTLGIEKAAVYLENKLKRYGIKPYFETYRDTFKVENVDAYNIVGFIDGNDPKLKDEFIILGAHYDHIGFGKTVANDSIANGANDDATGVSAVMALARYFAAKKTNKRSVIFAMFSAEEMGLIGSKHLAAHLKTKNLNLYTMLEFEMIGVPMKAKDYKAYITGYELSNMADKINAYTNQNFVGLFPKAKAYKLFYRSDNYSFFKMFSTPCQTISTFDFTNYEYYHHVDDEADQMDYEFMADLLNTVAPAIEMMSITPTREIKMNE